MKAVLPNADIEVQIYMKVGGIVFLNRYNGISFTMIRLQKCIVYFEKGLQCSMLEGFEDKIKYLLRNKLSKLITQLSSECLHTAGFSIKSALYMNI